VQRPSGGPILHGSPVAVADKAVVQTPVGPWTKDDTKFMRPESQRTAGACRQSNFGDRSDFRRLGNGLPIVMFFGDFLVMFFGDFLRNF
jgi:hypothetical protein